MQIYVYVELNKKVSYLLGNLSFASCEIFLNVLLLKKLKKYGHDLPLVFWCITLQQCIAIAGSVRDCVWPFLRYHL